MTTIETVDAVGNAGTAYSLAIGQTAQGLLSSGSDHDWYRVALVGGQTYTFAMTGTGTNNVVDPYLRLYAPDGVTLLAQNDDGLPGSNSIFTYTAPKNGTYYIDAASYNNAYSGQYGVSATLGSKASFDVPMGAGVIDTDLSWNSTPGTSATVTYGFRQSAATYTASGSNIGTFTPFTAAEMAAVQTILQLWSDVCGVTFVQVNPGGYTNNATILFGNYNDPFDGAGAFAYYPGSTASTAAPGDVWANINSVSTSSLPLGSYSFFALMHEIGHTLGLSHPGLYNAAPGVSITYANNAQFIQDAQQYTVMSYFDEGNTGANLGGYPDTPLLFDVYALQQIYGANLSTRAGDTVYGFGSNAGSIYDFSVNSAPGLCIWDGGGADTLNCSGFNQNQIINLTPGTFSNIGGLTGNVSIALGATIETAIGGGGDDTLIASDAGSKLNGGPGSDTLTGGAGNDTLVGGAGNNAINGNGGIDTVDYSAAPGPVTVNLAAGTASNGYGGTDTLSNIENAIGGAGNDTLIGDGGSNTLNGGSGADTMNGGGGADVLIGGGGNDIYIVDNIGDVVVENPNEGNDIVYTSVSYTLPANVDSVVLIEGAGAIDAAGNGADNALIGNSSNNTLDGRGGNDYMVGGAGNDIYFVDSAGDAVVENPNGGNDIVYASIDYTIGANIESVVLVEGSAAINAAGNATDNALIGNSSNNTLDGRGGNDYMVGGAGNDIYFVDSAGDAVVENPNGGNDIVYASIDYTIGANVESLVLVEGSPAINAAGNAADNALIGNSGHNNLDGRGGRDYLVGNGGNDTFEFHAGEANGDAIADFAAGDSLRFVGYGTAADGAALIQKDATHWSINSADGQTHDVINLLNGATIHPSDYLFV